MDFLHNPKCVINNLICSLFAGTDTDNFCIKTSQSFDCVGLVVPHPTHLKVYLKLLLLKPGT